MSSNNSRDNLQGSRSSHNSLPIILDDVKAGNKTLFKLILTILAALCSIISGGLAGLAGSTIAVNIIVPYNLTWLQFLCVIFAIFIWTVTTLKHGISRGLSMTIPVTFVVLALMSFVAVIGTLAKIEFLDFTLVLLTFSAIIIFLPLSIISLFGSSYALAVFHYLVSCRRSHQIKSVSCFLFILSATLLANLAVYSGNVTNPSLENIPIESELGVRLRWTIVFCGFLFSISIAISSLLAVRLSQHPNDRFKFLPQWAIALCSWGATSL